jgi:Putative prokaryotic signal transducing protein
MSLVEAARFYNSFEAGLAQSRLEEAGIDSVLFDLEMATYGIGLSIPVRLMVLDDDLDVAIKALDLPVN